MFDACLSGSGSTSFTGWDSPDPDEVERVGRGVSRDLGSRYELRGYLGRGGYATVWRAYDCVTRDEVALKRFEGRVGRPRGFYRELSVLFRLRHERIARIVNVLEAPAARYLVLEFCAGGSLRPALSLARRAGWRCPPDRAAEIALHLAEALGAAHAKGMVHRDVKPENILFALPGDGPFGGTSPVKLADFGLARLLQDDGATDRMGRLSGSPAYMAPEQFAGTYGPASDLYALGVVLYELLSARPPFLGTAAELAQQHLRHAPPLDSLPAPWPGWLAAALDKDPSRRPPLSDWTAALRRAARPAPATPAKAPPKATMTNDFSDDLNEALDRDLDRLQPSLAALGALARGRKPPAKGGGPVAASASACEAVRPSLERSVAWEGGDAEETEDDGGAAPRSGMTLQTLEGFFDEAPAAPTPPPPPRRSPPAGVPPAPESPDGGSVEDILSGFDWR